jgi:hypothetical protein
LPTAAQERVKPEIEHIEYGLMVTLFFNEVSELLLMN